MNVLIASSYQACQGGNFIPSLLELGLMARKQGDTIVFIFPNSENAAREGSWCKWLEEHGFTVYLIDKHASVEEQFRSLKEIITRHEIHVLHTHFGLYNKVIMRFRRKLGTKILIHNHFGLGIESNPVMRIIRNLVKSIQYRLMNINTIVLNEKVGRSYLFARQWCVPNGLSMKRNITYSKTREECRALLGIREDEKLCLILGWSLGIKGLDIAAKAVNVCRNKGMDVTLCVVGFGSVPNDRARSFICEQAGIDPLSPWIRYWPDTEDIFSYYRSADVFISASRTEGFPYAILEAISQNTPMAISDIDGTRWAYSYDHAFPYPVEDPIACADAIEKALHAGRSESNYESIVREYSIEKWCKRILDIYHDL